MEMACDYLVIGSGLAGQLFALKVADHGRVLILSKDILRESNSRYAQGGVAAVWDGMVEQRSGAIVLLSSMAYYQGGVMVGSEYTASKAAIVGLTRHLARNGGPHGIRCNAVAPGMIETDMLDDFDTPDPATIPLRRLGKAEDCAGPIRFLCGPESSYMTGTVLNVTGGMILSA